MLGPNEAGRKESLFSVMSDDSIASSAAGEEPNFGLCFDIDGVLARGTVPLEEAQTAFKLISDGEGNLLVPSCFVTNAAGDPEKKARTISSWFNIKIHAQQIILAPTPLSVFYEWHKKRVLVVGQGDVVGMARKLGFEDAVSIDMVCEAFPALNYVDHERRIELEKGFENNMNFPRIEALVMIGEPILWERALQICLDLLISNGLPERGNAPETVSDDYDHLPVLACNLDLQFMAKASMPRIAHGAFLACLETLYERMTGSRLSYTSIIGKPSEITFRYAEHMLNKEAKRIGYTRSVEKIYFFGDNPEVDIVGANLYNNFLTRLRRLNVKKPKEEEDRRLFYLRTSISSSRSVSESHFSQQTARAIFSILVRTGVYKPTSQRERRNRVLCHRDFMGATDLSLPTCEVESVLEGMMLVLRDQRFELYEKK